MFKCCRRTPFVRRKRVRPFEKCSIAYHKHAHLFNAMVHHLRYSYLLFKYHLVALISNEFDLLSIDCHCKRLNKMPRHQCVCMKYCRRCQLTNHLLRMMQTFRLSRLMIKRPLLIHRPFHPHLWNDSVSRMILRNFSKSKNIVTIFWWVKFQLTEFFFSPLIYLKEISIELINSQYFWSFGLSVFRLKKSNLVYIPISFFLQFSHQPNQVDSFRKSFNKNGLTKLQNWIQLKGSMKFHFMAISSFEISINQKPILQ